jgi:hypothetical protein
VKPGRRTIAGHPTLLVAGDHLFELLSPPIVTHAAHGDPVPQSRRLSPEQSIELRPIPEPDAAAASISPPPLLHRLLWDRSIAAR